MTDIAFLAVLVSFFAVAVVFVRACERIIGPDLETNTQGAESESDRVAA